MALSPWKFELMHRHSIDNGICQVYPSAYAVTEYIIKSDTRRLDIFIIKRKLRVYNEGAIGHKFADGILLVGNRKTVNDYGHLIPKSVALRSFFNYMREDVFKRLCAGYCEPDFIDLFFDLRTYCRFVEQLAFSVKQKIQWLIFTVKIPYQDQVVNQYMNFIAVF